MSKSTVSNISLAQQVSIVHLAIADNSGRLAAEERFSPKILNVDGETASKLFADGVAVGVGLVRYQHLFPLASLSSPK